MGNGAKAALGAGAALIVVLLFLLFGNTRVEPVEIARTTGGDETTSGSDQATGSAGAADTATETAGDGVGSEPASGGVTAPMAPVEDAPTDETATATEDAGADGPTAEPEPDNDPVVTADAGETGQADAGTLDVPQTDPAATDATSDQDQVADAAPQEAPPEPPVFDLVRVEADGTALIAGRAVPGAVVTLMLNGKELVSETADAGGNFVAFTSVPGSEQAQSLSIRMSTSDNQTITSVQTVMISPATRSGPNAIAEASPMPDAPDQTEDAPSVASGAAADPVTGDVAMLDTPSSGDVGAAVTAGAGDISQRPSSATSLSETQAPGSEDAPIVGSAPDGNADLANGAETLDTPDAETETATEQSASAPQVLIADTDGVRVLQDGGTGPEVLDVIALDTISYDEQGDVTLAGRGTGTGFVRVYIDNEPIKTLEIAEDGQWRAPLPEVDTGIYTLRIDELDAEGGVVSRVETPFKREASEVLAAVLQERGVTAGELSVMTVQKGDTLWDISRVKYGSGIQYVRVFEANRDRIRDPHWIYPGQVFTLPQGEE